MDRYQSYLINIKIRIILYEDEEKNDWKYVNS